MSPKLSTSKMCGTCFENEATDTGCRRRSKVISIRGRVNVRFATALAEVRSLERSYPKTKGEVLGKKISDDLSLLCRSYCKLCGRSVTLTGMRNHTRSVHNLPITDYKLKYGQLDIIDVVHHKCHLCGKVVLMDHDAIGAHVKGIH